MSRNSSTSHHHYYYYFQVIRSFSWYNLVDTLNFQSSLSFEEPTGHSIGYSWNSCICWYYSWFMVNIGVKAAKAIYSITPYDPINAKPTAGPLYTSQGRARNICRCFWYTVSQVGLLQSNSSKYNLKPSHLILMLWNVSVINTSTAFQSFRSSLHLQKYEVCFNYFL